MLLNHLYHSPFNVVLRISGRLITRLAVFFLNDNVIDVVRPLKNVSECYKWLMTEALINYNQGFDFSHLLLDFIPQANDDFFIFNFSQEHKELIQRYSSIFYSCFFVLTLASSLKQNFVWWLLFWCF